MNLELITRLESLIDRLLGERDELLRRNRQLSRECDALLTDRVRVRRELDSLIARIDLLEGRLP